MDPEGWVFRCDPSGTRKCAGRVQLGLVTLSSFMLLPKGISGVCNQHGPKMRCSRQVAKGTFESHGLYLAKWLLRGLDEDIHNREGHRDRGRFLH